MKLSKDDRKILELAYDNADKKLKNWQSCEPWILKKSVDAVFEIAKNLAAIGLLRIDNKEKRFKLSANAGPILCAHFGHTKIQTACFGYFNCARCGAQVGDSLAGAYSAKDVVVVGHDCETCHEHYDKLKWQDKLLAGDPFETKTE